MWARGGMKQLLLLAVALFGAAAAGEEEEGAPQFSPRRSLQQDDDLEECDRAPNVTLGGFWFGVPDHRSTTYAGGAGEIVGFAESLSRNCACAERFRRRVPTVNEQDGSVTQRVYLWANSARLNIDPDTPSDAPGAVCRRRAELLCAKAVRDRFADAQGAVFDTWSGECTAVQDLRGITVGNRTRWFGHGLVTEIVEEVNETCTNGACGPPRGLVWQQQPACQPDSTWTQDWHADYSSYGARAITADMRYRTAQLDTASSPVCIAGWYGHCASDQCVTDVAFKIKRAPGDGQQACPWVEGVTQPIQCGWHCPGRWEAECEAGKTGTYATREVYRQPNLPPPPPPAFLQPPTCREELISRDISASSMPEGHPDCNKSVPTGRPRQGGLVCCEAVCANVQDHPFLDATFLPQISNYVGMDEQCKDRCGISGLPDDLDSWEAQSCHARGEDFLP